MEYEGMVYRPPSEANSFILQVTIGCAHNRCTFCTMYKDKIFRIRSMDEIRADIEEVSALYGQYRIRVFLADGDALVLPTEMLTEILDLLHRAFPYADRVTSYGAPRDVLRKSVAELKTLADHGLKMVYMGLESGDDEVLANIQKGVTASQIIEAGQKLRAAGILSSVTVISGLGGKERLRQHAIKTAEAVTAMHPDYLGFLTLMVEEGAPIAREIRDGRLTLLTPEEVVDEMELFLTHTDSEGTIFRANHASNYLSLKGTLNEDIPKMLDVLREVRTRHSFKSESWRAL